MSFKVGYSNNNTLQLSKVKKFYTYEEFRKMYSWDSVNRILTFNPDGLDIEVGDLPYDEKFNKLLPNPPSTDDEFIKSNNILYEFNKNEYNQDMEVKFNGKIKFPKCCAGMFGFTYSNYDRRIKKIDLGNIDFSNVVNAFSMFAHCQGLTTLDVSKLNTSKLVNAFAMFSYCNELTTLDVSKWNTTNLTIAGSMFNSCSELLSIDVSKWNTNNLTHMRDMFAYCYKLTTLDVSRWNTNNLELDGMCYMFYRLTGITSIDISGDFLNKIVDKTFTYIVNKTDIETFDNNTSYHCEAKYDNENEGVCILSAVAK